MEWDEGMTTKEVGTMKEGKKMQEGRKEER
jgi:hypothetical protein